MIIEKSKAGGYSFRGERLVDDNSEEKRLVDDHSEEKGLWIIIQRRKACG